MQRLVQQGTPRGWAEHQSSQPATFSTPGRSQPTTTLRSPPSTVTSKSTPNTPPALFHRNVFAPTASGVDTPQQYTHGSIQGHTMNHDDPSVSRIPLLTNDHNPYSPHKHLSSDGCIVRINPNAAYPPFGVGGIPIEYDSLGSEIKQTPPKLHTYSPPTKEQGLRWNDRIDGVLPFIERMEIWFPSVDSAGIINPLNLDYYCTNGMEAFVPVFADPLHNPRCNIVQLCLANQHVFSVLASALMGTQAYTLVIQARESHDGWRLWSEFRKHFETDGTKAARSEQIWRRCRTDTVKNRITIRLLSIVS